MTIKTEGVHAGEFLRSEASGTRSRENIVVAAGSGKLPAGQVLAKITAANALTATAKSGNTGDGTVGSTSVSSSAVSGIYTLTITKAETNGGEFEVAGPNGEVLGTGEVGTAFSAAGITFTLAAGSTDFVVGDGFTLTVKANLGEYFPYDDDGTPDDGRRTASAVLYAPVDATDQDIVAAAVVRDAEVIRSLLTGLDANGEADLASVGIIVRD